ncbi:MAG: DUF1648 domain-containing protein [Dehalococcoidia bacterium]
MLERLRRAYPLKLELIPLLLVLWTSYVVLTAFPDLPTQVPIHLNAAGEADRWGPRGLLLLLWAVQLGLVYVPATLLGLAFGLVEDFRPLINLPGKKREGLTASQGEGIRVWVLRLLLVTRVLAMALLALILYNSIRMARGEEAFMGSLLWVLVAALVAGTLFMMWRLLRAVR